MGLIQGICPCDLVKDVPNLYQGRLTNSGTTVDTVFHCTRTVLCFENDIRPALNKLIAKAIEAMREGGGRLLIRTDIVNYLISNGIGSNEGISITVAGHGMSPAVRASSMPFYTTKELDGNRPRSCCDPSKLTPAQTADRVLNIEPAIPQSSYRAFPSCLIR